MATSQQVSQGVTFDFRHSLLGLLWKIELAAAALVAVSTVSSQIADWRWLMMPLLLTATLTTFFFARLWRRSKVLTDVEYLELRYPGASGRFLRGFKALYLGGLVNTLIIGTQLIAIGEIGEHVIGIDKNTAMCAGAVVALIYSVLAGFTGVVVTDFLQFILAMAGSVLLAVFVLAVPKVGGLAGLATGAVPPGLKDLRAYSRSQS